MSQLFLAGPSNWRWQRACLCCLTSPLLTESGAFYSLTVSSSHSGYSSQLASTSHHWFPSPRILIMLFLPTSKGWWVRGVRRWHWSKWPSSTCCRISSAEENVVPLKAVTLCTSAFTSLAPHWRFHRHSSEHSGAKQAAWLTEASTVRKKPVEKCHMWLSQAFACTCECMV